MKIETELILNIKDDLSNPNKMTKEQIQAVAKSIKKYGFIVPIIVNKDNLIIDGHQRKKAAELLGIEEVPVVKLDVDKLDAKLLKQVLNKLKGTHDVELDLEEYKYIYEQQDNLDLLKEYVAMDEEYLNNIIRDIDSEKMSHTDDELDDVPDNDVETDIKYGDIIKLGNHRIMCGDSTKKEDVDKLMNGKKTDMVFTDPPYGINLDTDWSNAKSKLSFVKDKNLKSFSGNKYEKVIGDTIDYNPQHIFEYFNCKEIFLWGADYYSERLINKNKGSWFVWDKRSNEDTDISKVKQSDKMYGSCFELCWSKSRHKRELVRIKWAGIFGTEKEPDKNKSRVHPTQKPVELSKWFIEKFSKSDNIIVDLFLGSGSTLIAAEETNRICYGMELDPKYCEVICQRWENLTGKKRELISDN